MVKRKSKERLTKDGKSLTSTMCRLLSAKAFCSETMQGPTLLYPSPTLESTPGLLQSHLCLVDKIFVKILPAGGVHHRTIAEGYGVIAWHREERASHGQRSGCRRLHLLCRATHRYSSDVDGDRFVFRPRVAVLHYPAVDKPNERVTLGCTSA